MKTMTKITGVLLTHLAAFPLKSTEKRPKFGYFYPNIG